MRRLAVLGASGHGKVVADAAILSGWHTVEFFDDRWPQVQRNSHWSVVGDTDSLLKRSDEFDAVIVAIGDNHARQVKSQLLKQEGLKLTSIIHPTAKVSDYSEIGEGCFIAALAVVHVDAMIGDYCIVNTASVVEHDCIVGCAIHISPSAVLAGGVKVGDLSWIGMNSSVKQQIVIGDSVIVGAGSVVVKDLPSNVTVVGCPANIQK